MARRPWKFDFICSLRSQILRSFKPCSPSAQQGSASLPKSHHPHPDKLGGGDGGEGGIDLVPLDPRGVRPPPGPETRICPCASLWTLRSFKPDSLRSSGFSAHRIRQSLPPASGGRLWRRGWDSNPRNLAALRFSRPARSTTLPPLRLPEGCMGMTSAFRRFKQTMPRLYKLNIALATLK